MKQKIVLASIVTALVLAAPQALFASAYEVYGSGSRGASMGGAFAALADDYSALHYNVAGLIADKRAKASSGFLYAQPYLKVNSEDQHLPDFQAMVMGISTPIPLEGGLENKIGFGMNILLFGEPDIFSPYVLEGKLKDVKEPHFLVFDNGVARLVLLLGLAAELHPSLLIGIGTHWMIDIYAPGAGTYHSPTGFPDVVGTMGFRSLFVPVYGVLFKPGEISERFSRLRIGFSYRERWKEELNLGLGGELGVGIQLDMPVTFRYVPREAYLGFAYDFTDNFTLSFDIGWENWERYQATAGFFRMYLDALGTSIGAEVEFPEEDFHDIWVPRIGGEYRYTSSPEFTWAFRGGYYYKPSPAPMQSGISNYLINDHHVFSLGLGVTIAGKYFENPLIVDLHVRDHYLKEEKHSKDPSLLHDDDLTLPGFQSFNPGYPELVSSGEVLSAGITLTFTF